MLGWDRMTLLRVATGRADGEDRADAEQLSAAGITPLALG
jgi:hypothetical protein